MVEPQRQIIESWPLMNKPGSRSGTGQWTPWQGIDLTHFGSRLLRLRFRCCGVRRAHGRRLRLAQCERLGRDRRRKGSHRGDACRVRTGAPSEPNVPLSRLRPAGKPALALGRERRRARSDQPPRSAGLSSKITENRLQIL